MISSLEELNQVVNEVVNRIVDVSTQKTMSGNRYASHEDVSDLISKEDFILYFNLIANELQGREEVLDLNITKDHELDVMYGLAYCPNYQWSDGDEEIFQMSEEEWEKNYRTKPAAQPLSMTRKAELLDNFMSALQNREPAPWLKDAAAMLGASEQELSQLGMSDVKALTPTAPAVVHDYTRPIEFLLNTDNDLKNMRIFPTFEEAVAAYDAVAPGVAKELSFNTYRNGLPYVHDSNFLLRSNGDGKDIANDYIPTMDGHIVLAFNKAILHTDPENKMAWQQLNVAESMIGVTGHVLSEYDLQVGNWLVRLVPPEGKYGVNNCITNDSGKFLVEFYDLRHKHPVFCPEGQFTGGRYYASTLLEDPEWRSGEITHGLCLDGGVPAWTVSAKQMAVAMAFIREKTSAHQPSLAQKISAADKRAEAAFARGTMARDANERA